MNYEELLTLRRWIENVSTPSTRELRRQESIQAFYGTNDFDERRDHLKIIYDIEDYELTLIALSDEAPFTKLVKVQKLRQSIWHRHIYSAASKYAKALEERLLAGNNK